jgi:hypothetical protein
MSDTPRTDNAAYGMGRSGSNRDGERWCDLLNESRAIERDYEALKLKTKLLQLNQVDGLMEKLRADILVFQDDGIYFITKRSIIEHISDAV